MIHVSDTDFKYTDNMFDAFRVGDIVRVKVISDKNGTYHLSTKGENLGVIYAFCSRCGNLLNLEGKRLKCNKCENVEKRKIASDYESGTL
jgi:exosome complex component CSL4